MRVTDFNQFAKENTALLAKGTNFDEFNEKCGNFLEKPNDFEYIKGGKALGSYEIEAYIPHGKCYIIAKKIYGLFIDPEHTGFIGDFDKKYKFRLKGISADFSTYHDNNKTFSSDPLTYFKAKIENPNKKVLFNTTNFIRSISSRGKGDRRTVLDIIQIDSVKAV
jgi:hypothetical protein